MNRKNEIKFVDPDFIFIPNKMCIYIYEFCFKFTLDVIKCSLSLPVQFFLKYIGISVSPTVKFILLGIPDLM